jgi:NAD-dependent SIR2 family protein deacetylase
MLSEGGLTTEAKPNAAHYAIAELNSLGMLDCVIAIINLTPTSLERYAVVLIRRKAGETMSEVMESVRERISPSS